MSTIFGKIDFSRCFTGQCLVWPSVVVLKFPKFQPVFSFLRATELFQMEELFIVRPITPLNDAVLPGTTRCNRTMQKVKFKDLFFKRTFSLWMSTKLHSELEGVVGPDEEKGGSKSNALLSTPATVAEFRS